MKTLALVDDQLAVVADGELKAVERPRRRSFEVQAGLKKAAAVAGTFEFVLRGEPARRAAQVGALGENRINAGLFADDPDALVLLILFADFADRVVATETRL